MKGQILILLLLIAGFTQAGESFRFASIFSDNMVLQQKSDVCLWGYSDPNEQLFLTCSWLNQRLALKSESDGNWKISVKTPSGSFKSHTVSISNSKGEIVKLSNVLIGEVWLCSGQSNMEMILMNRPEWNLVIEGSEDEIAGATNPNIRFVNIQRKESFLPLTEVLSYSWKVCTPNDVKWLSAVAYFFGKNLHAALNVPVGLIVSSYGGSPIQSWIPEDIISKEETYFDDKRNREEELNASTQTEQEYRNAMAGWIVAAEEKGKDENIPQTIVLPVNFEKSELGNQMGEVSLTREFDIPADKTDQKLNITLGTMDDFGRVYFNGELVWEELCNSKSYQQIQFTVSPDKIKPTNNVIEVRVLNILWGGGLTGPAENMYFTSGDDSVKTSLAGVWRFRKIFDLSDAPPVPREGKPLFSTASSLYNGMIYPLRDYGIKGCLWYQGESNVGDGERYPKMMTDLITSWRKTFGSELPFYFVQIAPYKYGGNQNSAASELREAQSKVESMVAKTGMVVTLDLGNPQNIHPAKKREVGSRLANMALSGTYGKKTPSQFPKLKQAEWNGNMVLLTFTNTYKGLTVSGDRHEFELSVDGKIFYPAETKLFSNAIQLSSQHVKQPCYVRYCWSDDCAGTIFNSEKLPLGPFRAEVSK